MSQVTKAALHPLIEVAVEMPEIAGKKTRAQVSVDPRVKFAGKTMKFPQQPMGVRISGTLLLSLKGGRVEAPVKLDMVWKRGSRTGKKKITWKEE